MRPSTPVPPVSSAVDPAPVDYQQLRVEDFNRHRPYRFNLVADCDELNRRIAAEAVALIEAAHVANHPLLLILPVGPLDFGYWARRCAAENVSCEGLTTMCMDEYLDASGDYISAAHPLSFRGFIQRNFIAPLPPRLRPDPANVKFPDPRQPERTTALLAEFGGAAVCYGGMGITGHLAFNDPPEPGEPVVDDEVRSTRTRCVTITRESTTQMVMGGANGNWEILPRRAVTLGMHELLMSRRLHLTFMRSWHAGVLRRALFGPPSGHFPGSFVQLHPNVEVTLTRLAASVPVCNVTQATGEEGTEK